jgi:hypothetical protein
MKKIGIIWVLAFAIGVLVLWSLRSAKVRAHAASCGSNLSSVSLAGRLWSNDHTDTLARSLLEMSNEVITPKVLICPSDDRRKSAEHWNKITAIPWPLLTTNDFTYEWIVRGEEDTNMDRIVIRCPIHGFTGLASGSVRDRWGKRAPGKGL